MVAVTEHYLTTPTFTIVGGADYDFRVGLTRVTSTVLDGKITELLREGPYSFAGWQAFAAVLATHDGTLSQTCSVIIDGPPEDGVLRLRGVAAQTWRLQQAGARAGRVTIVGSSPTGHRASVVAGQWVLVPGSTPPGTPTISDVTLLR
jgi:hypothetical protein